MVETALINQQNKPVSFRDPSERIDKSFEQAEIGAKRQIGSKSKQQADIFTQTLSQYGGEALKTGAAQQGYADIYARMNTDISNMILNYSVEKQKVKLGAEQFLQNLTAKGILDPKTGSFLRSTFDQDLMMQDISFQNQLELLNKKVKSQQDQALWSGLGTLAGSFFGPVGSMVGGTLGGFLGGG